MIDKLATQAEIRAQAAENLPAFSGIKLLHVKRQLEAMLAMIGHNGFFSTYTRHDVSHVDEMLRMLDWLVPPATAEIMTPADWLMAVLACYFHDLGMVVTEGEYDARNTSDFPSFRDNVLFAGDKGVDYRARISSLSADKAERFLYQEFVRHTHAQRIRLWISGKNADHLGAAGAVASEMDRLLSCLDPQFRRDLALICESHHLDDLGDVTKYQTSRPYGNSDEETASLQYAAILLRTADLLHITRDRTPSIIFRLINPADPLSQEEWAKQMAVKRVRAKLGVDKENRPDEAAPRDTIEVHAHFTQEEGFFGLNSYLLYTQDQLRKSHDWARDSGRRLGSRYDFPWRWLDDTHVETDGFLKTSFEFTIDQAKILDLLTGHTLYNDTSVVLRELVQNALDAVRLQHVQDQRDDPNASIGEIRILWDSRERTLSVVDTGTGMSQQIIEKHLLKVGSSRYDDPEFKKQFPGFSAISRFGIGVLSAFMVADSVEIITSHPDDAEGRHLTLRSVHGKYLVRLFDKRDSDFMRKIGPHGTVVRLKVRPSANVPDVLETAQRWVVVPGCKVSVTIDGSDPVVIGHRGPREALVEVLRSWGVVLEPGPLAEHPRRVKVEERQLDGVTIAYAVEWSDYFQEWSFMEVPSRDRKASRKDLGTCIEGIRVEFSSPGFEGDPIVAIANATGSAAPKTNVARSGIEATGERDQMLQSIYTMYCAHVRAEIDSLIGKRGFSLTWAIQEASYLLRALLPSPRRQHEDDIRVIRSELLGQAIAALPLLIVEEGGSRRAVDAATLLMAPAFWTVDCAFFRSAELLLREAPGSGSLSRITQVLEAKSLSLPDEPVLCSFRPDAIPERAVLRHREVDTIRIGREQRRIDLRWVPSTNRTRWRTVSADEIAEAVKMEESGLWRLVPWRPYGRIAVGQSDISLIDVADQYAAHVSGTLYIFPGTPPATYFLKWFAYADNAPEAGAYSSVVALLFTWVQYALARYLDDEIFSRRRLDAPQFMRLKGFDVDEFLDMMHDSARKVFNTDAWHRGDLEDE